MKVIDLLNKIANKEHNFSFKYEEDEFFYDFDRKIFVDTRFKETFGERYSLDMILNDEVEVIEEDKKIEKIIPTSLRGIDNLDEKIEIAHIDTISAIDKINEIIDRINNAN